MVASKLRIEPVTEANWPDMEALFESKGGPKYCWCMAWRTMAVRTKADNAARKMALRERVQKKIPIGILGYLGSEPVAWCSVAPRETFRKLRDDQDMAESAVWSITCFFVRSDHRKSGLSAQMLEGAVKHAQSQGAETVEGYPVDPASPSYRFMGFVPLFAHCGFKESGAAGSRRHVMRREV